MTDDRRLTQHGDITSPIPLSQVS